VLELGEYGVEFCIGEQGNAKCGVFTAAHKLGGITKDLREILSYLWSEMVLLDTPLTSQPEFLLDSTPHCQFCILHRAAVCITWL
jgi:hypothetical protein